MRIVEIMETEQIDIIFRAAFLKWLEHAGWGAQARIAKTTGISPSYINDLKSGRRYGSEEQRRAIADAMGLPYEDVLTWGRQLLGITSGTIIDIRPKLLGRPPPFEPKITSEIRDCLWKAAVVLSSEHAASASLKSNIETFYEAVLNDEELKKYKARELPPPSPKNPKNEGPDSAMQGEA